jgi:hypothetical protein
MGEECARVGCRQKAYAKSPKGGKVGSDSTFVPNDTTPLLGKEGLAAARKLNGVKIRYN